jgi:hypothetical protein
VTKLDLIFIFLNPWNVAVSSACDGLSSTEENVLLWVLYVQRHNHEIMPFDPKPSQFKPLKSSQFNYLF